MIGDKTKPGRVTIQRVFANDSAIESSAMGWLFVEKMKRSINLVKHTAMSSWTCPGRSPSKRCALFRPGVIPRVG